MEIADIAIQLAPVILRGIVDDLTYSTGLKECVFYMSVTISEYSRKLNEIIQPV